MPTRQKSSHFPPQTRDHLNPTSGLANLCSNLCLVGMLLNYRGYGRSVRGWESMHEMCLLQRVGGCDYRVWDPWEVLNYRGWGSMGGAELQRVGVHGRC